jgi:hypothetical protein
MSILDDSNDNNVSSTGPQQLSSLEMRIDLGCSTSEEHLAAEQR